MKSLWDITDRKQAEDQIQHLNATLRAICNVNQLITKEKDRGRLLEGVCRILTEGQGYLSAWVALMSPQGAVQATFEAGLGDAFSPLAEQMKRGQLPDCARRALDEPGVAVISSPPVSCRECPLLHCYPKKVGSLSARLEHEGKVYGVITVSIATAAMDEEEEQALFHELTGDLAFALHSIEMEETQQRAEEALRANEARFRGIFESAMMGTLFWNADGDITEANDTFLQIVGYTREQVLSGKIRWRDMTPPEFREQDDRMLAEIIETGVGTPIEKEYIRKDGSRVPVLLGAASLPGQTVNGVVFVLDITRRRRAEEALLEYQEHLEQLVAERTAELRASEEKLRAQYKGIPVPTATWQGVGEDFVLVDYNDALEEITRGGIAGFVGMKAREMYQDRSDIVEGMRRCFAEKAAIQEEMSYRYKSTGEERHLAVKYAFVPPDQVLVHTEDVTERVHAEAELRKRTAGLKRMVNLMAGREVRMAALKDVVRQLRAQLAEAGLEPVADDPLLESASS